MLGGSPAIDKGSFVTGITTDQRGSSSPYDNLSITNASGGNGSDIGAFEAGAGTVEAPTANAGPDQAITLPLANVTLAGSGTANNGGSIITIHGQNSVAILQRSLTPPFITLQLQDFQPVYMYSG